VYDVVCLVAAVSNCVSGNAAFTSYEHFKSINCPTFPLHTQHKHFVQVTS
jgi:hypothetical protein